MNYEQAIVSYGKALDIDPKNISAGYGLAEAYEKLADLYLRQNKTEEAKELRVTLTSEDNRTIFYTTDGTQPDSSAAVCSEPLILRNGVTDLRAVTVFCGAHDPALKCANGILFQAN